MSKNAYNLPRGVVPYLRGIPELYPSLKLMLDEEKSLTKKDIAYYSFITEAENSHKLDGIIRRLRDNGIIKKADVGKDKKAKWMVSPSLSRPLKNFLILEGVYE